MQASYLKDALKRKTTLNDYESLFDGQTFWRRMPLEVAGSRKQQPGEGGDTEGEQNTGEISLKPAFKTLIIRVLAILIYMCLGALVFCAIEYRDRDMTLWKRKTRLIRTRLIQKYNITKMELDAYEYAVEERGIELKASHHDWSYYQSLYFASTVTTTIGYGHLTPQTQAGRLFLIVFAVVGIPLNILALATVGEHITIGICFAISRLSRLCSKRRTIRHINIKVMIVSITLMVFMLFIGGALYVTTESWTYIDSIYYCFVALATIGFGDLVPNDGQPPETSFEKALWGLRVLYISIGLSLVSTVFTAISNAIEEINALLGWPNKDADGALGRTSSLKENESMPGLKTRSMKLPNQITYRTTVDEMHDNLASALPMPGFRSGSKISSDEDIIKRLLASDKPGSSQHNDKCQHCEITNEICDHNNEQMIRTPKRRQRDRFSSSSIESTSVAIVSRRRASLSSKDSTDVALVSPNRRMLPPRTKFNDRDEVADTKVNVGNGIRLEEISIDFSHGIKYLDLKPSAPGKLRSLNSSENDGYESSHCTPSDSSTNFTYPEMSNGHARKEHIVLDIESQISDFPHCATRSRFTGHNGYTLPSERPQRLNTRLADTRKPNAKMSWDDSNYTALKMNGVRIGESNGTEKERKGNMVNGGVKGKLQKR